MTRPGTLKRPRDSYQPTPGLKLGLLPGIDSQTVVKA